MSFSLILSTMIDNIGLGIALGPALRVGFGAIFGKKEGESALKTDSNVLSCQINKRSQ